MSSPPGSWRASLDRPTTRVIAFDPLGGHAVAFPAGLAGSAAQRLEAAGPLDNLDPAYRPAAVVAYERARRDGFGSAVVRLAGEEATSLLEVIDATENHGCFLGVITGTDDQQGPAETGADLPVRRGSYRLNNTGVFESVDAAFTALLGWPEDDIVGTSSLDVIHPDDHEIGIVAWIDMLQEAGHETRLRQRFRSTSGDWVWCEVTETNALDDPEIGSVVASIVDVSRELEAQAALQQRETLLQRLSQALPTGILHETVEHTTVVSNERWLELTGVPGSDGIERLLGLVDDRRALERALHRARNHNEDADVAISFSSPLGICRYGQLHLRPLEEGDTRFGLLATIDDTTAMTTYQEQLAAQARRDPLTGILNRLGIEEVLRSRLAPDDHARHDDAPAPHGGVSLLFCDLDGFKRINDTHGHATGDLVLKQVANTLGELVGSDDDDLGRLGGDEFILVMAGPDSRRRAEATATHVRERLATLEVSSGSTTRSADGTLDGLRVDASIGIATAEPGDDLDRLLARADAEMYRDKARRRIAHSH